MPARFTQKKTNVLMIVVSKLFSETNNNNKRTMHFFSNKRPNTTLTRYEDTWHNMLRMAYLHCYVKFINVEVI